MCPNCHLPQTQCKCGPPTTWNNPSILFTRQREQSIADLTSRLEESKTAIRELVKAGLLVEDLINVPQLLGASAQLTVEKAILRFREVLFKYSPKEEEK